MDDCAPITAPLVLASTSPRRRKLLTAAGYAIRVVPPDADETMPPGLCPAKAAEEIACRKAASVAQRLSRGLILGADTLVVLDDDSVIGKPDSREHAIAILKRLSGRSQLVITGLCLIDAASKRRRVASETTQVTMRPLSDSEIAAYVDSGEAMGKAGAYAIQETGDRFVERIDGSFSNVVGLPMRLLEKLVTEITAPP